MGFTYFTVFNMIGGFPGDSGIALGNRDVPHTQL
jgi:hypothetical protein